MCDRDTWVQAQAHQVPYLSIIQRYIELTITHRWLYMKYLFRGKLMEQFLNLLPCSAKSRANRNKTQIKDLSHKKPLP